MRGLSDVTSADIAMLINSMPATDAAPGPGRKTFVVSNVAGLGWFTMVFGIERFIVVSHDLIVGLDG